jgi:hypothetical protein
VWRHFLCLNRNVFCDAYNLRYGGAQFVISEARGPPSLAIYRHSEVVRSLLLFEDSIQHAHGQGTENIGPVFPQKKNTEPESVGTGTRAVAVVMYTKARTFAQLRALAASAFY